MLGGRLILFSDDARNKILNGVTILSKLVKATLGPRGRNIVIRRQYGPPVTTKDGVSVAKEVFLQDPFEDIGAQLVKEVASKTAEVAGDGTTTATVLAESIYKEGLKNIVAGANPISLKRGIDKATEIVIAEVNKMSIPVESKNQVKQVSIIAANGDTEIGTVVADAVDKVGKDGVIVVEEGKGLKTEVELIEGIQFDRGYLSPYFITDSSKLEATLLDPYILIVEKPIYDTEALSKILGYVNNKGGSILIIADNVEGMALTLLVVNKLQGTLRSVAVKAPAYGDRKTAILEDLAALTGATFITEAAGMDLGSITLEHLGRAEKAIVNKSTTTILGAAGNKEAIEQRINIVKAQLETTTSDVDKEKLQDRLSRLSGLVGRILVGAVTEIEMKEKKDRIEDALHATRAAIDSGILPGGGTSFIRCLGVLNSMSFSNPDELIGAQIVYKAIQEPLKTIAYNSGQNGDVILKDILNSENVYEGYDATDLDNPYKDLVKAGIIDPTKVVIAALQNAASVAGLLLMTEGIISEDMREMEKNAKL